jgi:hypothetical protein
MIRIEFDNAKTLPLAERRIVVDGVILRPTSMPTMREAKLKKKERMEASGVPAGKGSMSQGKRPNSMPSLRLTVKTNLLASRWEDGCFSSSSKELKNMNAKWDGRVQIPSRRLSAEKLLVPAGDTISSSFKDRPSSFSNGHPQSRRLPDYKAALALVQQQNPPTHTQHVLVTDGYRPRPRRRSKVVEKPPALPSVPLRRASIDENEFSD